MATSFSEFYGFYNWSKSIVYAVEFVGISLNISFASTTHLVVGYILLKQIGM